MARVLILWQSPLALTDGEAEAWVQREAGALLEMEPRARGRLGAVQPAAGADPFRWLLELEFEPGCDAASALRRDPIAEFIGDLAFLGLHPVALIAGEMPPPGSDQP